MFCLFWTFRVPWHFAYTPGIVPDWAAKFSFGFYSIMLTSTLIGLIVMMLYKPRTWCTFCPMGTMTQGICKYKCAELLKANIEKGGKKKEHCDGMIREAIELIDEYAAK